MAKTEVEIQFTFTLPIDESLLQHKTDAERKAKEVFVLELLRYGDISAGRAAKLLTMEIATNSTPQEFNISPKKQKTI